MSAIEKTAASSSSTIVKIARARRDTDLGNAYSLSKIKMPFDFGFTLSVNSEAHSTIMRYSSYEHIIRL